MHVHVYLPIWVDINQYTLITSGCHVHMCMYMHVYVCVYMYMYTCPNLNQKKKCKPGRANQLIVMYMYDMDI